MKRNKTFLERIAANWPAKALSLAAAIMLFMFHNFATLSERFISVTLVTRFADGYTAGQQYPRRVRVAVRGREKSIAAAVEDDLEVVADFSRFTSEGVYKVPVTVAKRGGLSDLDPVEIKVDPLEISLRVERKARRSVEVVPSLKGFPASGYGLEQYFLSPPRVDVEGPWSKVMSLSTVSTEDVDLTGKREGFSARVRLLREDPLLSFPSGDTVDLRVQIEEAVILRSFEDVDIVVLDLKSDLRIHDSLPKGSLRVQGGQNLLEGVRPERIRLVVDCSAVSLPGVYTLPVRTDLPAGLVVLRYEPAQVSLDIRPTGRER